MIFKEFFQFEFSLISEKYSIIKNNKHMKIMKMYRNDQDYQNTHDPRNLANDPRFLVYAQIQSICPYYMLCLFIF